MANILDSSHYVPRVSLREIESRQRLSDVFRDISQAPNTGSFILLEPGRSKKYVKAPALANAIAKQVGVDFPKWEYFSTMALEEVIAKVRTAEVFVDVDNNLVEVNSEENILRSVADRVFPVAQSGIFVGWYLNHESVMNWLTKRTIFICARGHRNPDPDTGTCYHCPSPIVKTEQE